ncbi:MAG TPA: hypothetical protein VGH27_05770 [Streptosporangiaceae bacterium]|jgi:hypothetical protein
MNVEAGAVRTQYQARPGRQAVVVADLASLRGPSGGTVVLPGRLFWSPAGRRWDLDDPDMVLAMYETVLQEAVSAEELASYLNVAQLIAAWQHLFLPKGVRQAWEEHHLVLRALGAAATAA